jgi:hypothetical protein
MMIIIILPPVHDSFALLCMWETDVPYPRVLIWRMVELLVTTCTPQVILNIAMDTIILGKPLHIVIEE